MKKGFISGFLVLVAMSSLMSLKESVAKSGQYIPFFLTFIILIVLGVMAFTDIFKDNKFKEKFNSNKGDKTINVKYVIIAISVFILIGFIASMIFIISNN